MVRALHKWVSILVAAPLLLVVVTGTLVLAKDWIPAIQPEYVAVSERLVSLSFDQILAGARKDSSAEIYDWADVAALDIRPDRGLVRVRSRHKNWELQLHPKTGEVLVSAPRRVTWLLELHSGAYFGKSVKQGVFLPVAIGLLALLVTGLWIFLKPVFRKLST